MPFRVCSKMGEMGGDARRKIPLPGPQKTGYRGGRTGFPERSNGASFAIWWGVHPQRGFESRPCLLPELHLELG